MSIRSLFGSHKSGVIKLRGQRGTVPLVDLQVSLGIPWADSHNSMRSPPLTMYTVLYYTPVRELVNITRELYFHLKAIHSFYFHVY